MLYNTINQKKVSPYARFYSLDFYLHSCYFVLRSICLQRLHSHQPKTYLKLCFVTLLSFSLCTHAIAAQKDVDGLIDQADIQITPPKKTPHNTLPSGSPPKPPPLPPPKPPSLPKKLPPRLGNPLVDLAVGIAVDLVDRGLDKLLDPEFNGAQKKQQTQPQSQSSQHGQSQQAAQYLLEYRIDGRGFASLEAVKAYMTGDYLKHFGQVWGRNRQGLDYYKVDVYLGSEYHGGIGYFDVSFYGVSKNSQDRLGGTFYSRRGVIYYKGNEEIQNVNVTDAFKAKNKAQTDKAQTDQRAKTIAEIAELVKAQVEAINAQTQEQTQSPQETPKSDTQSDANKDTQKNKEISKDKQDTEQDKPSKDKKPFALPAFCDWAKLVCDFMSFKEKPIDKIDPIKPKDINLPNVDNKRFNAVGQCPANKTIVTPFGGSIELSYQLICDFLAKLAPFIMASAYLSAAYIILRSE